MLQQQASSIKLPDPGDYPNAPIVIWDGECRFCLQQIERLRLFQGKSPLAYISLHDPRVARDFPQLSHEQLMEQMWVVSRQPNTGKHQAYGGADAIRFLSRYLPRLWFIAPVMHLPGCMPIWRWMYAKVAERRYAIAGKNCESGTCQLHVRAKSKG